MGSKAALEGRNANELNLLSVDFCIFPSRIDFLDFPGPGEWIFGARYMFDMHGMLGVLNIDGMHGLVTKCGLYFSPQKKNNCW